MKSIIRTMLAAILVLPAVTGCKKNTETQPEGNPPTAAIQKVKTWFEAQSAPAGRQRNIAASGSNMPAVVLQWHKAAYFAAERSYVVPAMLPQGNAPALAYLLITEDAQGAPAKAQYTLLLPDKKSMSSSAIEAISVTPGFLQGSSVPVGFTGGMAQFTGSGSPAGNAVYKNGQPAGGSSAKLHTKTAAPGNTGAAKAPCTGETVCTDWYWQTYVDGQLVDEEYLFTTCACDGGAGGGGMGEDIDPLLVQFNNYVQQTYAPVTVNAPVTQEDIDPISFTHTWVVAKGLFANWRVYATTRMDYYHKKYYDLQTGVIEHTYDIVYLKTPSTYYSGSQTFVKTTWTQTALTDDIHSNNTIYARGVSTVYGKLHHISNFTVPNPVTGGSTPAFQSEDIVPGVPCTTTPR